MKQMTRISLLLAAAVALCACAANQKKYSGFLGDYSQLGKHPDRENTVYWERPETDFAEYDELMIDTVVLYLNPNSEAKLTPNQVSKGTKAFRDILVQTVDPYYEVVDKPGPNVIRLRIAITDVEPSDTHEGGMNVGSASIEVEATDSKTGDRLVAAVSTIRGSKEGKEAQMKWRAVEGAFREWGVRLLAFMDKHHRAETAE